MTNEKLCLKWNDFQDLLQVSFGELRIDTDFTDVTLACEDHSIKAHKVVLSTCSQETLENLFTPTALDLHERNEGKQFDGSHRLSLSWRGKRV